MKPVVHWTRWLALALLVAVFGLASFARAMADGLNHDEHQFLAPAVLFARHGLLPFRDYPSFHLPTLSLIYALLVPFTDHLVFAAKGFSILCSTIAAGLVAWVCARELPGDVRRTGLVCAVVLLGLLFFDPLFDFTTGKIWNHEFPALCLVAALACVSEAARAGGGPWLALGAGAAVGAAVGARLTFVPIALPLGGAWFFFAVPWRERLRLAALFAAGVLILLLPAFHLWIRAPEAFVFDNFRFPRLRLLDPTDERVQKTMSWWRKLRFFGKEVVRPSWLLFLGYALVGAAPAVEWIRTRSERLFPAALILATLPFLLIGCGAPSRYQYQHFFAFVPVLALGIAYGLQARAQVRSVPCVAVVAVLAVISTAIACASPARQIRVWIAGLPQPQTWLPIRVHDLALAVRAEVPAGKILTLAPIFPLEAGLEIYPEFATGPFAWRGASLVEPSRRRRLKFVAPADLEERLAHDPPAAVLTGFERDPLELPLIDYAKRQNFRPVQIKRARVLWINPRPAAQESPPAIVQNRMLIEARRR